MNAAFELVQRVESMGAKLSARNGHLELDAPPNFPDSIVEDLRQHKAEILELLAELQQAYLWPPLDAGELLSRWEELDCPVISLSAGVSVTDLEKWLCPLRRLEHPAEHLATIRRRLWEGLTSVEMPKSDPLLEEWFRVSIPEWRRILVDAIKQDNRGRADYARWMLRDILLDPEYREGQS